MITIEMDHQRLQQLLSKIEWAVGDTAPLMRALAAEMASLTEENLGEQGRPNWAGLSDARIEQREKAGTWPGQILQVSSAGLAASISSYSTDTTAVVGSNKPYAAMMHFGGSKASFPHLWGDIPSRPFLPMDEKGVLQPEAEEALLNLALLHLQRAARL
ncbi:phage virion morphogenesis protein [Pseudomonas sp. NPDC089734]|uniref:phage virion morphogenesis protein n=1 Tax=Pseudomonas sp. NPDC089734 TaxID=3364469 RepID=UPI00380DA4A0